MRIVGPIATRGLQGVQVFLKRRRESREVARKAAYKLGGGSPNLYRNGKLIQLMDHYGLHPEFRQLESFLKIRSTYSHPLMWNFCQFLVFNLAIMCIPNGS